jgi:hypothetical protein
MAALRHEQIEHKILQTVLDYADHQGYPTDLSSLAWILRPTFNNINDRELIDALNCLRKGGYLKLCKYPPGQSSYLEYPAQITNEVEFFFQGGGFRLRRTDETDPRAQKLAALISSPQVGRDTEERAPGADFPPGTRFYPVPVGWRPETPDERFARAEMVRRAEANDNTTESHSNQDAGLPFIADSRIDEFRELSSSDFDFQKLIRLCEELNSAYGNENYYATAMLTRGILDHVPPLFGFTKFTEVANNYNGGGRSFKEHMQHLEGSARKVADGHLHMPIRKSETLPEAQQIWCGQEMDALLAEIVRIMK